jgi:hypothetical protein
MSSEYTPHWCLLMLLTTPSWQPVALLFTALNYALNSADHRSNRSSSCIPCYLPVTWLRCLWLKRRRYLVARFVHSFLYSINILCVQLSCQRRSDAVWKECLLEIEKNMRCGSKILHSVEISMGYLQNVRGQPFAKHWFNTVPAFDVIVWWCMYENAFVLC